jgi:hypothetical protein
MNWAARKFLEKLAADGPARRPDRRHPLGRAGVPRPDGARPRLGGEADPAYRDISARTAREAAKVGRARGRASPRTEAVERRRCDAHCAEPVRRVVPGRHCGADRRRR